MRIAYITSGAAGMYCGSCMRDNTLAAALIAQGHECVLIPTYTPIRTDETDVSLHRVFFGGINIYLEQKGWLFRRMPRFLNRVLSEPRLLRWVSRFGIKTRPEDLGALTVSMLKGMDGYQQREVIQLVEWLEQTLRPEIVCLTNILVSGLVPELKRRLRVPVVCTLQGDDIYLEWLPEAFKQSALELIRANCRHIDGYITTSRYYADYMSSYLDLPRSAIHTVLPGISLAGYPNTLLPSAKQDGPLAVGYMARICPEKGLQVLVDAFQLLRQRTDVPPCRLQVAGFVGERDQPFLNQIRKKVEHQGWANRFEYLGEPDHAGKIAFLRNLDVLSVPTIYREPKGLYILESWAAGVPVVQPAHGSFPELIAATGGGELIDPQNPAALAEGLARLLKDSSHRVRLGRLGHEGVQRNFQAHHMAERTLAVLKLHAGG